MPVTAKRDESERDSAFGRLVGQVAAMVAESGDGTNLAAGEWLARWLGAPLPAFGGICPVDLMGTADGRNLVAAALARLQSGAHA